eukprot:TRINITY_DN8687_c1_g1_i1.p1 TRINITY_DN8687_c1_g1~~TRINITY_DN8687_c1_g1_i1.p1  ORF type:complete len:557 (+),score=163.14 TRINITY_DN8687_c1_g1_i1:388-2058(+)
MEDDHIEAEDGKSEVQERKESVVEKPKNQKGPQHKKSKTNDSTKQEQGTSNQKDGSIEEVRSILSTAVQRAIDSGDVSSDFVPQDIPIGPGKPPSQGEYFSKIAFSVMGRAKESQGQAFDKSKYVPAAIANCICTYIPSDSPWKGIASKNGFINFYPSDHLPQMPEPDKKTSKKRNAPTSKLDQLHSLLTPSPSDSHRIEMETRPSEFHQDEFDLYVKYQMAIHKDKPEKNTPEGYTRFLCDSPLIQVASLDGQPGPPMGYGSFHQRYTHSDHLPQMPEPDKKTSKKRNAPTSKLDQLHSLLTPSPSDSHRIEMETRPSEFHQDEFDLYVKYQMAIHKDKPEKNTPEGYTRFLCDSPLIQVASLDGQPGPPMGYGSFHQRYTLNGQLIAVGVIDILPMCISSVYFFYDPAYQFLSMGVYSALRETMWTWELSKNVPQLRYYYMGFYIHSCKKMRYKGQYKPSDVLCPVNYEWIPLADAISTVESNPGAKLIEKSPPQVSEEEQQLIVNNVPVLIRMEVRTFEDLPMRFQNILRRAVMDYLDRVGPTIALSAWCSFH